MDLTILALNPAQAIRFAEPSVTLLGRGTTGGLWFQGERLRAAPPHRQIEAARGPANGGQLLPTSFFFSGFAVSRVSWTSLAGGASMTWLAP